MKTRAAISEGRTIAEPLEASGVFPGMVVQMIAVGEADRRDGLRCSARSPTSTTTRSTPRSAALTSLLEPLMMVFLGGTVGGILHRDVPADLQDRGDREVSGAAG